MKPADLVRAAIAAISRGDHDWVADARALKPRLDTAAPRIDAASALPPDILDALFESRMFRMLLPRAFGGDELDFVTFFDVVGIIAEGDASAAWSVAQSNGCAMAAASLDPRVAEAIFGHARAVLSWGYPTGSCRAQAVDGGWTVNGTWGFGSGNRHSTWLGGHCQVFDEKGEPQRSRQGAPQERTMLFERTAVTILAEQWNVIGLRGTGSDTYMVKDMFVPADHALVSRAVGRDLQQPEHAEIEEEPERREAGTLYRFSPTAVYQAGFSAVALGIARATLDAFIALAQQKIPSGGGTLLRDNAVIQARVAHSEARLASSRAWIRQILADMWQECAETGRHGYAHRIQMRLAAPYCVEEARQVVEDSYADAGATAIFAANPFERRLRDIHAVAQQVQANPVHFQTVGQFYLGLKPHNRFI